MIADPMHFSLSLDLVRWRANLWTEQQRCPNEKPTVVDNQLTLRTPCDEVTSGESSGNPRSEQSRFVRQPVRVVYSPRRPPHR